MHYARSEEDLIFAEELAASQFEDNHVDVHLQLGDDGFSAESLARLVPTYLDTDTWACGPAPMIEPRPRGVRRVAAAALGVLQALHRRGPRPAPPRATSASTRSGKAAANTGDSILEQAEAQGLTPEFGCRMGICFSCVSRKTEGTVRNVLTGEESSLPDEDIRICVSAPVGDCAVDL